VAVETGDTALAIEHWDAVRRIDPYRGTEAHLGLAAGLRALREPRLALDALEFGIEHFPRDPDLRRERGRVLVELGFRRAAVVDFEAVAHLSPADPLAWCELAGIRAELHETCSAADTFEWALGLDACPAVAFVAAARVNLDAQRFERAHDLYATAVERLPEDPLLLAEAVEAIAVLEERVTAAQDGRAERAEAFLDTLRASRLDWRERLDALAPDGAVAAPREARPSEHRLAVALALEAFAERVGEGRVRALAPVHAARAVVGDAPSRDRSAESGRSVRTGGPAAARDAAPDPSAPRIDATPTEAPPTEAPTAPVARNRRPPLD